MDFTLVRCWGSLLEAMEESSPNHRDEIRLLCNGLIKT